MYALATLGLNINFIYSVILPQEYRSHSVVRAQHAYVAVHIAQHIELALSDRAATHIIVSSRRRCRYSSMCYIPKLCALSERVCCCMMVKVSKRIRGGLGDTIRSIYHGCTNCDHIFDIVAWIGLWCMVYFDRIVVG